MLPPSVESTTSVETVTSPQADASQSNSATAAADVFTVNLSGIPVKLCNEACLDAILWAAGVQRASLGYQTKRNGHITINFGTLDAATNCYNHFKACSWTTGKLSVDLVLPGSKRMVDGHRRSKHDSKGFPGRQQKFAQQMW